LTVAVCDWFEAASVAALPGAIARVRQRPVAEVISLYSRFAPRITDAADGGSALASGACLAIADELCRAMAIVARQLAAPDRRCALVGSVARSAYISKALAETLRRRRIADLVEPALPPVGGAFLLARRRAGLRSPASLIAELIAGIRERVSAPPATQ
jgi:hypothetical protein